jgi:hypothetical protein
MNTQTTPAECCPKFNPAPWDEKTFTWTNKKFIKDKVFTLFYIPVNFGSVMERFGKLQEKAGATTPEGLCLSEATSLWNMNVYAATDKEIPDAENVTMNGSFFSKVYEGDFKNVGTWIADFDAFAKNKGLAVKKKYMWYTTCPKCAKKYGKNYVVLVAELKV